MLLYLKFPTKLDKNLMKNKHDFGYIKNNNSLKNMLLDM